MVGGIVGVEYYVYQVTLGDEVVYIGKGKGERYNHVLSGKSHNYNLNKLYFEHLLLGADLPVVDLVGHFYNSEDALKYETYLIRDLLPTYNIRSKPVQTSHLDNVVKPEVKVPTNVQTYIIEDSETIYVNSVPTEKNELMSYLEDCYNCYLENTTVDYPMSFRTFVRSRVHSGGRWQEVEGLLVEVWESIPPLTSENGGHNRGDLPKEYNLNTKELKKFNNRKAYLKREGKPYDDEVLRKYIEDKIRGV